MADQPSPQSSSSTNGLTLEALMERQDLIKSQIAREICGVQDCIQNLTAEMANEVKEYTAQQVHSSEEIFQDIDSLQHVINDLGASQAQMQKLFACFSGNLSSILQDEQANADRNKLPVPQSSSPSSSSRSFTTPPAFSMAQAFNREGYSTTTTSIPNTIPNSPVSCF